MNDHLIGWTEELCNCGVMFDQTKCFSGVWNGKIDQNSVEKSYKQEKIVSKKKYEKSVLIYSTQLSFGNVARNKGKEKSSCTKERRKQSKEKSCVWSLDKIKKYLFLWGKYMCYFTSKAICLSCCDEVTVLNQNVKVMMARSQLRIWCIISNTIHERYHKNQLILIKMRVVIILKLPLIIILPQVMKMEIQKTDWK